MMYVAFLKEKVEKTCKVKEFSIKRNLVRRDSNSNDKVEKGTAT